MASGMAKVQEEIGYRIRNRRKELGISREQLAENADVGERSLGHIERGEHMPRVDTLLKIADGLRIPATELIRGIEVDMRGIE